MLSEPTEIMELRPKGATEGDILLGAVSLEYSAAGGATKFLVGTEQGSVLNCNRKAKTPADQITTTYIGHHGPIYGLERNPAFPKFFLTVGDWTARIWMEDVKTPIMCTSYFTAYITAGCWSPTRPAVFFTAKDSGDLDAWDLTYKQNTPTLADIKVSPAALQCVDMRSDGRSIAVGAADGTCTIVSVSDGLCAPQSGEKQAIGSMFEREVR
jgi:dynein intermediate chain 2